MKKYTFIFIAILFLLSACSYEPGVSEAFNKYRFKEGVTTITVPGWVIHLAAALSEDENPEMEFLESIDKVKVISVEDQDLNKSINLHDEFYDKINREGKYEELMVVRDDNESVTIFGVMEEDVITEMLILVGGEDNALIYVKGEISPDLLNDKINLSNPEKLLSLNF